MTYQGIFIRDQLGQLPGQPSAGWSDCPDVIFMGQSVITDFTTVTSNAGYAKDFGSNVTLQKPNYVYLRGLNANSVAQGSHMFFYYTESDLMLWPKNWKGDKPTDPITVNGQNQNWSLLQAVNLNPPPPFLPQIPPGVVGVTNIPFIWTPPDLHGSQWDHYCVITWADNNPTTPTPPDLASWSQFNSVDDLATFVQTNPNMGWRNTTDIPGGAPQYSYNSGLSFQSNGGNINVSVNFFGYPTDGTFSVFLQGTNSTNTINAPNLSLKDYQGGYNVQGLLYPPNFNTSLQVTWYQGATAPGTGAYVLVSVTTFASPLLIRRIESAGIRVNRIPVELFIPTYDLLHGSNVVFDPTPVIVVGTQKWTVS